MKDFLLNLFDLIFLSKEDREEKTAIKSRRVALIEGAKFLEGGNFKIMKENKVKVEDVPPAPTRLSNGKTPTIEELETELDYQKELRKFLDKRLAEEKKAATNPSA